MDWENVVWPAVETIRSQYRSRLKDEGIKSVSELDQEEMLYREMIQRLGVDEFTDRDIYMVMVGFILVWWIALKADLLGQITDDQLKAVIKTSSTAAFAFLYTEARDWL